jgi:apolipoprotein N-acyltransferase
MPNPRNVFLCLIGGTLLGFAHPPFETGMLAAAGFVPLFLLLSEARTYGEVFRRAYALFFVFNLIALYWPGGFVHGKDGYLMISGALLLLAHPIFMALPVLAWHSVRKSAGIARAVAFFPFLWVAFEYLHASTQLSFPWLTMGYTQSYDPRIVQLASVAGVYGLSFWLLSLNVLLWFLFVRLSSGPADRRQRDAVLLIAATVVLYAIPIAVAPWTGRWDDGKAGPDINIAVIQPDIDPFEKWRNGARGQVEILRRLTDSALVTATPDIVLWPETAIPFYILSPANAGEFARLREYVDRIGVPLLTGIPDMVVYKPGDRVPPGAKSSPDGTRYDSFNSSAIIVPGTDTVRKFAKSLLVPFAERVPYSDVLTVLNAAQWNFGLGGWSMGRDTTLLTLPLKGGDTVAIGNLICYESVYPAYVADLVRRGARFLTVITNDSWWGNTSGVYQHRQFAVLRAVENRRWVVQCANGGISFVIDPSGTIRKETALFTRTAFQAGIGTPSGQTFYTRHGDWLAEGCALLTLFALFSAWLHRMTKHRMEARG